MKNVVIPASVLSPVMGFPPIADARARVLILGSMPGKESLRAVQYYAHPRNAFWQIMDAILGAEQPLVYAQRTQILRNAGIAVWDVLASCVRASSLDSDIEGETLIINDFDFFYRSHPHITHVFFNGAAAEKFYRHPTLSLPQRWPLIYQRLPSTSPAHAGMRYAEKLHVWEAALKAAL